MDFKKILKAITAGFFAGTIFMIIFPAFLIILNINFDLAVYQSSILFYLGSLLILFGILIFCYCTGLFSIFGRGTPAPIEPPEQLVIKGIYKYTRNPMYIGYFSIILGEFFVFGYLLLFYYFIFILILINVYVIYFEEPTLEKRFGQSYIDYKARVGRWFSLG